MDKLHRVATFLHPQLKSLKFAEENDRSIAIRDAKQMISTISITQTNAESSMRRKSSTDSVLSDYFDDDFEADEIDMYSAYRVATSTEIDMLVWWEEHRESFPKLYHLSSFIHSIPATSAPSERKFSLAGKILNCLRSSLDPTKVSDLLLLYSNSDKFDNVSDDL